MHRVQAHLIGRLRMEHRQRTLPTKFKRRPRHHIVLPNIYVWLHRGPGRHDEDLIHFHEWAEREYT